MFSFSPPFKNLVGPQVSTRHPDTKELAEIELDTKRLGVLAEMNGIRVDLNRFHSALKEDLRRQCGIPSLDMITVLGTDTYEVYVPCEHEPSHILGCVLSVL